ncbi:MAG: 3-deoxy-8-phosphooctulonate synthase [Melioribacteraceae bacterium]|nr:3-deoxy-8-phosphooctulonate synthase [Melioribacteraceae bacterium]
MIKLQNIKIGDNYPFVLIAGPCVVENEEMILTTAAEIKRITSELNIPFIFKSSYKKANRTSLNSFVGLDIDEAISILQKVKTELDLPIITDVHNAEEISFASEAADILQIPAFLCRQTDLLITAGQSGKIVNIKKGQFMYPPDMKHAAEKVKSTGNDKIMLTERGTTFGYKDLVVDMRSLVMMKELGYPIVMDATHSVQSPGSGGITSGKPEYILPLAKAATAVGIDALFLEVHPDPPNAMSDAASQLPLNELENLLVVLQKIDSVVKNYEI